ncbi:MAG: hypothetical protein D6702_12560 [Planctomycetota bacterium]|nr:MAG: hypothetical protein D6702_12560 [Planctomycetota bacterium]
MRPALPALLLLAAAVPFPAQESDPAGDPAARPRSVLFYLIDTCRYDRLSADGYDRPTSPFLAELAARSVVFEHCSSQAPWTKPSMASLLTSSYLADHGMHRLQDRLPDEALTFPEVLRDNGWFTAGFSANIVMGNLLSNYAQGFDSFVESTVINGGDPIRFASGSARKLNEIVLPWLQADDSWPLLLYLHSVDPHEEYEPAPEYLERFADPARHDRFREEWRRLLASRPPIPGLFVTQENFDRTGIDRASFIRHASNLYDGDVCANDDEIGRLWRALADDGWGEDMIVIVTSDHGEEFFEHGGTSHGYSLYEEMVRVPLMIYAPGLLPAGRRVTEPVRSIDIFPTLLDLLDIPAPPGLAGRSLVPLARGEESGPPPDVIAEHREDPVLRRLGQGSGVLTSIRRGHWKLLVNHLGSQFFDRPRLELYDLAADPGERHNVAAEHPDLARELEREVEAFRARHGHGAEVAAEAELDPAVLEELRGLGYLGEEEDAEAPAPPDLWAAVAAGDPERVRAALAAGAPPDQREEVFGTTPLQQAASRGDRAVVEALLAGGAGVDFAAADGTTPLIAAAFFGRAEVVRLLLARGADPARRNRRGDDALSATRVPWDLTAAVMKIIQLDIPREEVERGRREAAALLRRDPGAPG